VIPVMSLPRVNLRKLLSWEERPLFRAFLGIGFLTINDAAVIWRDITRRVAKMKAGSLAGLRGSSYNSVLSLVNLADY